MKTKEVEILYLFKASSSKSRQKAKYRTRRLWRFGKIAYSRTIANITCNFVKTELMSTKRHLPAPFAVWFSHSANLRNEHPSVLTARTPCFTQSELELSVVQTFISTFTKSDQKWLEKQSYRNVWEFVQESCIEKKLRKFCILFYEKSYKSVGGNSTKTQLFPPQN